MSQFRHIFKMGHDELPLHTGEGGRGPGGPGDLTANLTETGPGRPWAVILTLFDSEGLRASPALPFDANLTAQALGPGCC